MFNESALAPDDAPGHQRLLAQIAEARLRAQFNGRRRDAEIFAAAPSDLSSWPRSSRRAVCGSHDDRMRRRSAAKAPRGTCCSVIEAPGLWRDLTGAHASGRP